MTCHISSESALVFLGFIQQSGTDDCGKSDLIRGLQNFTASEPYGWLP